MTTAYSKSNNNQQWLTGKTSSFRAILFDASAIILRMLMAALTSAILLEGDVELF